MKKNLEILEREKLKFRGNGNSRSKIVIGLLILMVFLVKDANSIIAFLIYFLYCFLIEMKISILGWSPEWILRSLNEEKDGAYLVDFYFGVIILVNFGKIWCKKVWY